MIFRIEYINEFDQLTHCYRSFDKVDDIYEVYDVAKVKEVICLVSKELTQEIYSELKRI